MAIRKPAENRRRRWGSDRDLGNKGLCGSAIPPGGLGRPKWGTWWFGLCAMRAFPPGLAPVRLLGEPFARGEFGSSSGPPPCGRRKSLPLCGGLPCQPAGRVRYGESAPRSPLMLIAYPGRGWTVARGDRGGEDAMKRRSLIDPAGLSVPVAAEKPARVGSKMLRPIRRRAPRKNPNRCTGVCP